MEDPSLLVLDEPFNGLDKQGVREMRELIKGLRARRERRSRLRATTRATLKSCAIRCAEMDAGF